MASTADTRVAAGSLRGMGVEWLVAIVAVVALCLSLYNTYVARRAPAKARQDQLWESLEQVLRPLLADMEDCLTTVKYGQDVDDPPPTFVTARNQFRTLGPRFAEQPDSVKLTALEFVTEHAKLEWETSRREQVSLQRIDESIERARERGDHANLAKLSSDRESQVRTRDAAQRRLEAQLAKSIANVKAWIDRADTRFKR